MRTHYGPWQPCWISNQHQTHKSGRGPSSEHFWQVWLISVQRFQRRRFKCEKLTEGRTDGRRTLTHDKSSHGLWPGQLKIYRYILKISNFSFIVLKYFWKIIQDTIINFCSFNLEKRGQIRSWNILIITSANLWFPRVKSIALKIKVILKMCRTH